MIKSLCARCGVLLAIAFGVWSVCAQGLPASGLYQIVSGKHMACCGIAGPIVTSLPDGENAFVELTVDPPASRVEMRVIGRDMRSVLRVPAEGPRDEFTYAFTNGIVYPDHIQFGEPTIPPLPTEASYSFVVSNSLDTLRINGVVITPCPGCADFFTEFQHTNVVAILMPTVTIRVSEVELCFQTALNRTYQVQYISALTSNKWIDLGRPVAGTGSAVCITTQVTADEPRRYYRVLTTRN